MLERAKLALIRLPILTRILVLLLGAVGIAAAVTLIWLHDERFVGLVIYDRDAVLRGQIWRFATGHFVSIELFSFVFGILGAIWFIAPMERTYGTARTATILGIASLLSFAVPFALSFVVPTIPVLAPRMLAGPYALLEAAVVAWLLVNPDATVRLFFFFPLTGRQFLAATFGIAFVSLIFGSSMALPSLVSGGFALLFAGKPSFVRRYLLERKQHSLEAERKKALGERLAKSRKDGPNLNVVYGGLHDESNDDSSGKPKDKRFLH